MPGSPHNRSRPDLTIRLRPHHLLCLLTYVGKGYSHAFTANFDAIVERIAGGEEIVVVDGLDDICAPLLDDDDPHCFAESVVQRDRDAADAIRELLSHPIEPGERMTLDAGRVAHLWGAFKAGTIRKACSGCEWAPLCTDIASK